MGEYFKSWRRKIGVMMLMLACVFAAAWVRSFASTEWFSFATGRSSVQLLGYFDGHVMWTRYHAVSYEEMREAPSWGTQEPLKLEDFLRDSTLQEKWQCGGLTSFSLSDPQASVWIIPMWLVTAPLALLSAWLLLSKPRDIKMPEDEA